MERQFPSGDLKLAAHLALPPRRSAQPRALVLCHGYPPPAVGSAGAALDYPELADRISATMGWIVLTFTFRGCGTSEGQYSMGGWLDDVGAAVTELREHESVDDVWLAGFGTGGGLCICAGAQLEHVRGVAALGAPADFDDWAGHPRRLLQHSRDIGVVTDRSFPPSFDTWARQFRRIRPTTDAAKLAPRPLLVVHGSDDDVVPPFDARVLVDAHGSAELRLIAGAGHALRHDPRAVAVLLGWLDRTAV